MIANVILEESTTWETYRRRGRGVNVKIGRRTAGTYLMRHGTTNIAETQADSGSLLGATPLAMVIMSDGGIVLSESLTLRVQILLYQEVRECMLK